ncbi:uncharacterized protein LOC144109808 [Amblyomma americanum]
MTPLRTTQTTTTTSTTSSTEAPVSSTLTATMTTTTSLPERSDAMPAVPLVCTVSSKFTAHSLVPEDGTCDFLFFESLYDDERNFVTPPHRAGFRHFLRQGLEMKKTALGISFSPLNDTVFIEAGTPKFFDAIDHMWNHGVSHFGALDLQGAHATVEIQKKMLKLLQKLYHRVSYKMTAKRRCYTVIAAQCQNYWDSCIKFSDEARHPDTTTIASENLAEAMR